MFPAPNEQPVDMPAGGWTYYALIDDLDHSAVLAVVRTSPGRAETYTAAGGWQPDDALARDADSDYPPILRPLTPARLRGLLDTIGVAPEATAAEASGTRVGSGRGRLAGALWHRSMARPVESPSRRAPTMKLGRFREAHVRISLLTVGMRDDVHPFVALAPALQERGCE